MIHPSFSSSSLTAAGCGGHQGALVRACDTLESQPSVGQRPVCDRTLSTGNHGKSGGMNHMRIHVGSTVPAKFTFFSPNPLASSSWLRSGLFPHQRRAATSWQGFTGPGRQRERRGALWKEAEVVEVSYGRTAAIYKTWLAMKEGERLWVGPVKPASLAARLPSPLPWLDSTARGAHSYSHGIFPHLIPLVILLDKPWQSQPRHVLLIAE